MSPTTAAELPQQSLASGKLCRVIGGAWSCRDVQFPTGQLDKGSHLTQHSQEGQIVAQVMRLRDPPLRVTPQPTPNGGKGMLMGL